MDMKYPMCADKFNRFLNLKKIKISELSEILEVSVQFLSQISKGRKKLSNDQIEKLSLEFNFTREEIKDWKMRSFLDSPKLDNDLKEWFDELQDDAHKYQLLKSDKRANLSEIIDLIFKIDDTKIRKEILEFIKFKLSN